MRRFYIFLFLVIFVIPCSLFAQSSYEISGKIMDGNSDEPVPFAQVALYEPGTDTPVTGGISDSDGAFTIQANSGEYRLEVVFVGYKEKKVKGVQVESKPVKIGVVSLAPNTKQLKEVIVVAEEVRRPISTDMEGIKIRPDQTISNVGGSLLDVLRNTPSVNVSQDGTVSIRGSSGTNVLLDGRNSVLAADLEQIPASAIEQINIVNNPNAKYDAEGAGGVINIQLKKGEQTGTNGKAEITVGTRYRLNSNLNLSHKSENYSIYGGYSYRRTPSVGYSKTTRLTFDDNQRLEQFNDRTRNDNEHTINLGGDYYFGKNKLSYEGAVNFEKEADTEDNVTQVFNTLNSNTLLQYNRINQETEDNYSLDNAIIYERIFDQKGKEFRALVSHSYRDQFENQAIDVYSGTINPIGELPTGEERAFNDEQSQTSVIQADFVQPFDNSKLEAGYKTTLRSFDNNYMYEILNQSSGQWVNQDGISNRFLYQDQVHALYAIYSRSFDNFDLSVGSRLEQTFVDTKLYNTGEENKQQYINLFPSMQALYNLDDQNSLKLTYSRRIDRPNGWRLNPFPDIGDSLNIRLGNPNLQPEFIHSVEFGHMLSLGKAEFTSNAFFRHVDGQVDYIVRIEDGISFRMPTNLNTSMTYGFEFISTAQLTSWWSINGSFSIFRTEVDGSNLGTDFSNAGYAWNTKLTTDINLPLGIDFQLTGNYTAPEIEAQGRDLARYYIDLSLQRQFYENRATVSLSYRDIFDTRNFAGENFGENFSQSFEYKRESQILLLTVGYSL